jgi:hypothetical protein
MTLFAVILEHGFIAPTHRRHESHHPCAAVVDGGGGTLPQRSHVHHADRYRLTGVNDSCVSAAFHSGALRLRHQGKLKAAAAVSTTGKSRRSRTKASPQQTQADIEWRASRAPYRWMEQTAITAVGSCCEYTLAHPPKPFPHGRATYDLQSSITESMGFT